MLQKCCKKLYIFIDFPCIWLHILKKFEKKNIWLVHNIFIIKAQDEFTSTVISPTELGASIC